MWKYSGISGAGHTAMDIGCFFYFIFLNIDFALFPVSESHYIIQADFQTHSPPASAPGGPGLLVPVTLHPD